MIDLLPGGVVRLRRLLERFQKFLVVGAFGFGTNQGLLWFLHEHVRFSVFWASPVAILASMALTFYLNEIWTWHDRGGPGWIRRASTYIPINLGGLLINWSILTYLYHEWDVHYLFANIVGAGIAAVWNFGLNHTITWKQR